MRWSGQQLAGDETSTLPGMKLGNLVRSVTTPEFAGIRFHEVLAKSALNHVPGDSSMPFNWTVNPYRGCSHACYFCFARNTHTYLDLDAGADFDSEIVVKVNVAEVLARELAKSSWKREAVALGTNTDPYQRAEGRYRLMPGIIAGLAHSGTPFSILTKGTLLRRDLPLLVQASEQVAVDLAMTIAVHDDELQRSVEPGAPATKGRLETVSAIREAGLDCTVFLMPVLPYLTDSRAHLEHALRQVRDAGATSVVYSALHLRPGAKQWFMAWLEREHPQHLPRYRAMYGSGAYAPKEYRQWLAAKIRPLIRSYGLERGRMNPYTRPVAAKQGGGSLIAHELPPGAAPPTLF